jgi:hypothetical protein
VSDAEGTPLRVVIGAGPLDTFDFFLPYRIMIENGTSAGARGVIVWHVVGYTPEDQPLAVSVAPGETQEFDLRVALEAEPKRLAVLLRSARLSYNAEVIVPTLDAMRAKTRPAEVRAQAHAQAHAPVIIAAPPARIEPDPPAIEPAQPTVEPAPPKPIERARPAVVTVIPALRYAWPVRLAGSATVLFALVAGVSGGATLLAGTALVRPDVVELAVPSPVAPGASLEVPYRVGGWGHARYRLTDARGTIDAGPLAGGAGTLHLRLPAAIAGRSLLLSIAMSGPFGAANRSAAMDVLVPARAGAGQPAPTAPRISLVAVARATVRPGEDVHITYRVEPPSGDVAIVDAFGDTLASAPVGPAGQATLRVPLRLVQRDLAVVVRAGSGATAAQSRIPLELAPAEAIVRTGLDAGPTGGDAGLTVIARRVTAGDQIRIRIDTAYDSLRLELFDAHHRSISAVALGPGIREAALIAPHVDSPTTYTLEATDIQGDAASTSIFPITVTPP